MCGIVGYVGPEGALGHVLLGIETLEYRGYDSAGIGLVDDGKIEVVRTTGRVTDLRAILGGHFANATCVIGHTRWATHGRPAEHNAHPQVGHGSKVALVHNGIIENYAKLRQELEAQDCRFASDTDTEAAAHLISSMYQGDLRMAMEQAIEHIEGSFAFAAISPHEPGRIVCAKRGVPLVLGLGDGFAIVASDALPIIAHTRRIIYLDDNEIAAIDLSGATIWRSGSVVPLRVQNVAWDVEMASRGGHAHFMLKEIHEQPSALRRLTNRFVSDPGNAAKGVFPQLRFEYANLSDEDLRRISRIVVVAQGTSYHAGLVARNMIERLARIPVQVDYGSDFHYRDPVLDPSVLVLGISQSGETADTLGAIRLAHERGCKTLSVLNVQGSTMARESDGCLLMHAGPEIGVASTKAFTAELAALYVLAIHLGVLRGTLDAMSACSRVEDLLRVATRVEEALSHEGIIRQVALGIQDAEHVLYLGRGMGYPLALEGALKLKEVSYIHAEGLDAAEMKHGPIALVNGKMPVVVLALKGRRYEKIISNIQEVRARGGRIVAIASHDDDQISSYVDDVLRIHDDRGIMNSIACAIPLQLIAYHVALAKGCDVDKPRHLAKSVTVE